MAIHTSTRPLGRAGGPLIHVPSGLLFGAWAVVAILTAAYLLESLMTQQPTTTEDVAVAPVAAPASPSTPAIAVPGISGTTVRVETDAAEVDSQAFILEQAGLVGRVNVGPRVMPAAMSNDALLAPAVSRSSSTRLADRVEAVLAEVDTQAYILSEAADAIPDDLTAPTP